MSTYHQDDGYQMSEYEKMRLERIAKNEKYLESLGLGSTKQKLKDMTQKTKKNKQKALPKIKPGDERRSKRIKNGGSGNSKSLVMLSYNEDDERVVKQEDDEDYDFDDDENVIGPSTPSRRYSKRYNIDRDGWEISDADKKTLEKDIDDNYLAKFKEFLVYHNKISEQNVRNVMKQVRKLATGVGIRYESPRYGWPEDCYFMKGTVVTPLSDIVDLMEKAQDCEDRWGRDHGNGWLLSHPLKKLLLFQQFVLNNPDFLSAKCKLKEYYDLSGDDDDDGIVKKEETAHVITSEPTPDIVSSGDATSPEATPSNGIVKKEETVHVITPAPTPDIVSSGDVTSPEATPNASKNKSVARKGRKGGNNLAKAGGQTKKRKAQFSSNPTPNKTRKRGVTTAKTRQQPVRRSRRKLAFA